MKKVINVNEISLCEYTKAGKAKDLYVYYLLSYITAGLGYFDKDKLYKEVYKISKTSKKTYGRWLERARANGFIRVRKGVVYVKSKNKLGLNLNNTYVQFSLENLQSYREFQRHTIRQIAVLTQRRFKYAYKFLSKDDAASLVDSGKIETALEALRNANQAGCSISQLVKKLGLDKKTISLALKGFAKKQVNYDSKMAGKAARKKYGSLLTMIAGDKVKGSSRRIGKDSRFNFKLVFKYNKKDDTYQIGCRIASKIDVIPCIKRKRSIPHPTNLPLMGRA